MIVGSFEKAFLANNWPLGWIPGKGKDLPENGIIIYQNELAAWEISGRPISRRLKPVACTINV
jgi:hypothetical protein